VILFEALWNLIEKHGFQSDWYKTMPTENEHLGGNVVFAQLLIDGMKIQPCTPNFIQARDAIIEADRINNHGENFHELWEGFAKRGLGKDARYPGIDNFSVPEEDDNNIGLINSAQTSILLATTLAGLMQYFH